MGTMSSKSTFFLTNEFRPHPICSCCNKKIQPFTEVWYWSHENTILLGECCFYGIANAIINDYAQSVRDLQTRPRENKRLKESLEFLLESVDT